MSVIVWLVSPCTMPSSAAEIVTVCGMFQLPMVNVSGPEKERRGSLLPGVTVTVSLAPGARVSDTPY